MSCRCDQWFGAPFAIQSRTSCNWAGVSAGIPLGIRLPLEQAPEPWSLNTR